jgi:hypothetical protein
MLVTGSCEAALHLAASPLSFAELASCRVVGPVSGERYQDGGGGNGGRVMVGQVDRRHWNYRALRLRHEH